MFRLMMVMVVVLMAASCDVVCRGDVVAAADDIVGVEVVAIAAVGETVGGGRSVECGDVRGGPNREKILI